MGDVIGQRRDAGQKKFETVRKISLTEIESAINLEAGAYEDGSRNHPPAASWQRSTHEQQVDQLVSRHVADIKEFAHAARKWHTEAFTEHDIRGVDEDFSSAMFAFERDKNMAMGNAESTLLPLFMEEQNARRNLNLFRALNKLQRHATYPKSTLLHIGVLMVVFLLECIGNMYFFAEGSQLGFVGGFFQATLVSVANVGLSYIVGCQCGHGLTPRHSELMLFCKVGVYAFHRLDRYSGEKKMLIHSKHTAKLAI